MACIGVFVAYLPVTTVSVSLPAIQRDLHASTSQLSWVSDAFVLPMAALILTAGVVGDVHGRKKVFQAGLLFSAAGAAVAMSAQSVQVLWAGQALAGTGAAALLPTTLALISHAVPNPHERAKFVGLWAAALSLALAVGPLMAGVILQHTAWHWIYLPAIPVALLTMAVAVPLVADSRAPGSRKLDWPGQFTAALTIVALVYGVIEGGAQSFSEPEVVVALALAAVGALAFVLAERRSPSPMLDLTLFRSAAFSATTLIAMISFLGLIGFFFVLSLYFGMVQRLDTLDAGYRMLMVTAVSLLLGVVVGPLMRRIPARALITTGLLATTAALLSLTALDAHTAFGPLAWRLALLGLGMGLVITPMTATAVASVPHHLAGMAAAGNNAFRQVGGALGPAVLGTLLTTKAADALPGHLADAGVNGATAHQVTAAVDTAGLGAVSRLDLGADTGRALGALSESFLDGLQLCLIVAASLALVAAVVGAVLLRKPKPVSEPGAEREPAPERASGSAPEPASGGALTSRSAPGSGSAPEPAAATGPGVTGRVSDGTGNAMAGATLTLISLAGRQVGRAVAHDAGRYRLTAPGAGSYVLIAAADGHQPQAATLVLGEEPLPHDVVLSGGSGLAGTVATADDRLPVEGATVVVTDIRGDVLATGMTDMTGAFGFGHLPAGDLTIAVNAPGHRPAALPVTSGAPTTGLEILLRPGARLQGVVRAGDGRNPVADARVTLVDAAGNVVGTAITGTDGAYAFTDLDAGDYSLIASGYAPVATTVTVDGRSPNDVHPQLAHQDS
ncbi:MFS transporter [Streptomyces purpurascens]|uniref:MFS transporter n=1 Tax=Streptomyces purpurascens TaxID=1924 RepID=A0ABZ1MG36_STREF|nr:MFS transporter [Streptomyces purpurascens]MCE7049469.1 MFS transporter [Streptomyces purpurascens]GHA21890.1 MFS transporter [Streptomyces purpurascens]